MWRWLRWKARTRTTGGFNVLQQSADVPVLHDHCTEVSPSKPAGM